MPKIHSLKLSLSPQEVCSRAGARAAVRITRGLLQIDETQAFTKRNFYTEKPAHRAAVTHRSLYTEKPLRTETFTWTGLYTEKFYIQKLLHANAFAQEL